MQQAESATEKERPVSVGFVSLGCAKNLVDSQIMAGALVAAGIALAPDPETADVVLVNTCAFIEDAREEAAESILWACSLKTGEGPVRAVIVAGCMSQRYRDRLFDAFPDIDAVIGLDELEKVAEVTRQVSRGVHGMTHVAEISKNLYRPRFPGLLFTGGPFAYLKIAEGCNHVCAFCAIPAIRGRHRSRTMAELVDESKTLVDQGIRELNLISQDVTAFGRDRAAEGASLPALLRRLDVIEGDFWLRLLYGYPTFVTDELLETMAGARHVCRYLDVPIQHSHPDVLRAMLRADTIQPILTMAERVRRALPGVALRTTCLVGFPGETEEHFAHLLQFVKAMRFEHLGAFVFSPEEGTAAWDLDDLPDLEVAEERRDRLMTLQQQITARRLAALVGEESLVLLEQRNASDSTIWEARSQLQAPEVDGMTLVHGVPDTCGSGAFVRVKLTESDDYDLGSEYVAIEQCQKG